jgi:serine/threonine protein kinase
MNLCPNCCNSDLENNICPKCGYKLGTEERSVSHLPYGVILQNRYFIGKVLGEGGFGITYLGFDTRLGLKIAVKEYYPTGFVSRESNANTHTVHSFVGSKEEVFKAGLERFLKEAKRLTKFDKSNGVVSVKDVFSENNTAYIVMEFIEGTSLSNILKTAGKVSEKSTLEMFIPIIKTLAQMHAEGIIHRDIAPDNIMVQPDGTAKLIDFGAAIESDSNSDGKSTVALVKHGYAAEENYDNHHTRQGTWTDVYSLCASMYKTLTGTVPPDAMDRLRGTPLPEITVPVSETVKKAIYQGMAVAAKDRIQTMTELLNKLEAKDEPAHAPVSEPVIKAEVPVPAPKTETVTETVQAPAPVKKAKSRKPFIIIGSIAAAIVLIVGVALALSGGNNKIEQVDAEVTTTEAATTTTAVTTTAVTTTTPTTTTTAATTTTAKTPETKLVETIDYLDNGTIRIYSHLADNGNYAGYVMSYKPDVYIAFFLPDTEGSIMTGSEYSVLYIDLDKNSDNYGRIEMGDSHIDEIDSDLVIRTTATGEMYLVGINNSYNFLIPDIENYNEEYWFDNNNFELRHFDDNGELTGTTTMPTKTNSEGFTLWYTEGKERGYINTDVYSGWFKAVDGNWVKSGYGYYVNTSNGYTYRGFHDENSALSGLGILVFSERTVAISNFTDGKRDGYGLALVDGKAYFTKYEMDKQIFEKEIEGIEIDKSIFIEK